MDAAFDGGRSQSSRQAEQLLVAADRGRIDFLAARWTRRHHDVTPAELYRGRRNQRIRRLPLGARQHDLRETPARRRQLRQIGDVERPQMAVHVRRAAAVRTQHQPDREVLEERHRDQHRAPRHPEQFVPRPRQVGILDVLEHVVGHRHVDGAVAERQRQQVALAGAEPGLAERRSAAIDAEDGDVFGQRQRDPAIATTGVEHRGDVRRDQPRDVALHLDLVRLGLLAPEIRRLVVVGRCGLAHRVEPVLLAGCLGWTKAKPNRGAAGDRRSSSAVVDSPTRAVEHFPSYGLACAR
ncbi:MAG: hypothetical protein WAT39_04105 [Planctomycetota bacterium]